PQKRSCVSDTTKRNGPAKTQNTPAKQTPPAYPFPYLQCQKAAQSTGPKQSLKPVNQRPKTSQLRKPNPDLTSFRPISVKEFNLLETPAEQCVQRPAASVEQVVGPPNPNVKHQMQLF
ncbi:hypothetical protein ACTL6U_11055, partial [Rhodovibrionaceae bacterium A322]